MLDLRSVFAGIETFDKAILVCFFFVHSNEFRKLDGARKLGCSF